MTAHQYAMILLMAAVVICLRALPALLWGGGRKVPARLLAMSGVVTAAVIAMLVVYGMADAANPARYGTSRLWAVLTAAAVTALLHWKFRNALLSILAGTALYMVLLQSIIL